MAFPLITLSVVLASLAASLPAYSQCLPWTALLRAAAEGRLSLPVVKTYIPQDSWEAHESSTLQYWQYVAPTARPAPTGAEIRLELRRVNQQPQPDLVYKTTQKNCLNELRAALRRARLKSEPVTCLQCEAERFVAEGYILTLYNQVTLFDAHKVSHPFVLVLHSTATPVPSVLVGDN